MANARFMYDNLADSAALSESSEATGLPVENLQNELRTKVWQTGVTLTDESVVFDFGSAQSFNCIVLLDHDLTSGDSGIVLEGNATDSWGAPSFSQSLTRVTGPIAAYFASQSYRYARLFFTKSASSESRQIGRVFIGTYYELAQNPNPTGLSIKTIDLSKVGRSIGGQSYADIRSRYDEISLNIDMMPHSQYEQFKTIDEAVGIATPFFVSLNHDTEPVDWIYYVKNKSIGNYGIRAVGSTYYWSTSLQLEEQL